MYKCGGMAAPLVTFRQMVPGLKGMKRIFDSLKDILNFNEEFFFLSSFFLIDFQAALSTFPDCAFLLTLTAHLAIFLHHLK